MKKKKLILIFAVQVGLIAAIIYVGANFYRLKSEIKRKEERIESSQENRVNQKIHEALIEEEEIPEIVYSSSWHKYEGDKLDYADKKTFQKLKEIYERIDFSGEYKKGNTELNDYYKEKYAKLLSGKAKITNNDGEEHDLEYYGYKSSDLVSAELYYFDMDEDGLPELCLTGSGTYVIKYIRDKDQYRIWWGESNRGAHIAGSRKIQQTYLTRLDVYYWFYQMKENGEVEFSVECRIEANEYSGEYFYIVTLPEYKDETGEPEIQKELKEQMDIDIGEDGYDFRITEKQYEEIINMSFKSKESLKKETVNLSYFLPENKNVYSSYFEIPDDMIYADQETFEMVENIYERIGFYGEYKKEDSGIYDKYKEKYTQLLSGKTAFVNPDGNEYDSLENYINNYTNSLEEYRLEEYLKAKTTRLYYFDMDEDNLPELCIEGTLGIFIFKYDSNKDQFSIWWENWPDYSISGSKKIRYSDESYRVLFNQFLELNENGNVDFSVEFGVRKAEEGSEVLYLVSLPIYMDKTKNEPIPESIKNQSCVVADNMYNQYFIRLTKEQYEKITKDFFEAEALAIKEVVNLSYFFPGQ